MRPASQASALERLLAGETVQLPTAGDTQALGQALGEQLRAGDLVLLTGDLAAGKTTLSQGIGAGLGVRGPITSPTFVIARVHPSLSAGPDLVHVDAYRLGGLAELDDLDLDADLDAVVTVVEWGHGLAEGLADERLEIVLSRAPEDGAEDGARDEHAGPGEDVGQDQARTARAVLHGPRWQP